MSSLRVSCRARIPFKFRSRPRLSISHLTTSRPISLTSSAQLGHFVNSLRRANRLAGAFSSPISHHRAISSEPNASAMSLDPQSINPPKRVKGWPTPILTQEDVDTYLTPLYKHGWSVEYRPVEEDKFERIKVVPALQSFIKNLDGDKLIELGNLVQQLEKSENVSILLPFIKLITTNNNNYYD